MTMQFADIARQAAADGVISAEELLALRRSGWADGAMKPDEAEALVALNDALAERSAEWCDFFIEALGEFVINSAEPKGYVSEDNAAWLMSRLDRDGSVESMAELELLVRVVERAQNAPATLKNYVLAQVEQAVLTGKGQTRRGELSANGVNDAEAQLLRRVLFAPAGDAPAAVSRAEAELLFRLKDATLGAANGPEWKRLFAQGVGNYLQGFVGPSAQLSRERAAELEAFMADKGSSVGGFIRRAATAGPDYKGAFAAIFGEKGRDRFGELAAGEQVTSEESAWLETHVHADGEVDEYEQALLEFLAGE
jgi:hypothetical protein